MTTGPWGLRCAGADHEQDEEPEERQPQQFLRGVALVALGEPLDGAGQEIEGIGQGDGRPEKGKELPVFHAEQGKEEGGAEDDAHGAPAVEGMQQAHHAIHVLEGAGLHNRAHQHLDEPAADSVEHHGNEDAQEGGGQQLRQYHHQHQTECRNDLRDSHAGAVADFVCMPGGGQVHKKLGQVEGEGDESNLLQRDPVDVLEGHKEKRGEVRGDSLRDEP